MQLSIKIPSAGNRPTLINEIKGLAIVAILLNHAGGVLDLPTTLHGNLGSDIFFLVSGMALAIGRNIEMGPTEFIKRRLIRIIPTYWIVLSAYLFLEGWILNRTFSVTNIVTHYLAIHSFFGDHYAFAVCDGFWFITAILGCYGFFIATRHLLEEKADRMLLISAILTLVVISVIWFYRQIHLLTHVGFRMGDFCCGMLVGAALRKGELKLPLTPTLGLALLLYVYMPYTYGIVFYSTVVAAALVAFYTFSVRRLVGAERVRGGLGFLGKHSFEIFLIHQPLMREFNLYALDRWGGVAELSGMLVLLGILCSVVLTLVLSVQLHHMTKKLSSFLLRNQSRSDKQLQPAITAS